MSYRNPQAILDRSAEFMIRGFQQAGANFIESFTKYRELQYKQKKAAQKQLETKQLYSNKALQAYMQNFDDLSKESKLDQGFLGQLKQASINQLTNGEPFKYNGVEYNVSALTAQTELAVNPNLTSDQRAAYAQIASNAKQFQVEILGKAGDIIGGLKPLEEQSPYTIGTNYDIAGEGKDEFQNLIASNALLNRKAEGVNISKKFNRTPNEDGTYSNIMNISASFDTNSDLWKRLKETYNLEDSDANFVWSRDVNKFAEGGQLLSEIAPDFDTNEALKASGFIDEKNNPTKKGLIEKAFVRTEKRGNQTIQIEETHFDPDALWNDRVYNDTVSAKVDGFLTLPQDQVWKFMKYKLPLPEGVDRESFFSKEPGKQRAFLVDLVKQKDIERIYGADFSSRSMTEKELAFYKENGLDVGLTNESGNPVPIYYKAQERNLTPQLTSQELRRQAEIEKQKKEEQKELEKTAKAEAAKKAEEEKIRKPYLDAENYLDNLYNNTDTVISSVVPSGSYEIKGKVVTLNVGDKDNQISYDLENQGQIADLAKAIATNSGYSKTDPMIKNLLSASATFKYKD
jgi:hypothetical protein